LPARSSASTFGVVASAVARCQMRGGLRLSSTVVVKGANPATVSWFLVHPRVNSLNAIEKYDLGLV